MYQRLTKKGIYSQNRWNQLRWMKNGVTKFPAKLKLKN